MRRAPRPGAPLRRAHWAPRRTSPIAARGAAADSASPDSAAVATSSTDAGAPIVARASVRARNPYRREHGLLRRRALPSRGAIYQSGPHGGRPRGAPGRADPALRQPGLCQLRGDPTGSDRERGDHYVSNHRGRVDGNHHRGQPMVSHRISSKEALARGRAATKRQYPAAAASALAGGPEDRAADCGPQGGPQARRERPRRPGRGPVSLQALPRIQQLSIPLGRG